jgi:type VI secretion system protein ImpH
MVTARRREAADLKERLHAEPHRFDFFQAVRLLERLAREESSPARQPVGTDAAPGQECVRFRALPSLSHPAAAVAQVRPPVVARSHDRGTGPTEGPHEPGEGFNGSGETFGRAGGTVMRPCRNAEAPPEMVVAFLGLTGPAGVLPPHYTALLLRRLRAKDTSLRDLFDLFSHRLVSLFYRAWGKYRLPLAYERSQDADAPDRVTQVLHSLVGRGTAGLRGRREISEETFLYYAGHFAHHPRSAAALERMLSDHFALVVRVVQFQGQRLRLDCDDRTRLPSRQRPRGLNCRLGVDLVLGDHVWDAQGKLRLRIGPLTYREFCRFFPAGGDLLRPMSHLTRSYVGEEFTFDLQPVLRPGEVPGRGWAPGATAALDSGGTRGSRRGPWSARPTT